MDRQALADQLRKLPRERTMLLPALHQAHDLLGYLPGWAMEEIGSWLHVPKSEVYGAATSYAAFRFSPPPRHRIKVCCGASCRVNGSADLLKKLEPHLSVGAGTAAQDRNASIEKSDCLFACGAAPVLEIGEVTHGRISDAKLAEIIRTLTESD